VKNIKRTISTFLVIVILMTHLVALLHNFNHLDKHHFDEKLEKSYLVFKTDDKSNSNELCDICNIYLDIDLKESKIVNYVIITPQFITNKISQQEEHFIPLVLYQKQSRAPPYQIS
jgi:hypothetical protein